MVETAAAGDQAQQQQRFTASQQLLQAVTHQAVGQRQRQVIIGVDNGGWRLQHTADHRLIRIPLEETHNHLDTLAQRRHGHLRQGRRKR
ncbi:hypothetical protein D3C81_1846870 [compost metagenome]